MDTSDSNNTVVQHSFLTLQARQVSPTCRVKVLLHKKKLLFKVKAGRKVLAFGISFLFPKRYTLNIARTGLPLIRDESGSIC